MEWEAGYVGGGGQQLRDFVDAAKAGDDVKVWYPAGQGSLWIRRLRSVAIFEDEDQGVPTVGGALNVIDTNLSGTTGRDTDSPLSSEWQTFNTSGMRDQVKWPERSNCFFGFICRGRRPSEAETNQASISWLKRSGWEMMYEHEANGAPRSGSFEALHFFVSEGYDVKVRYFQTFRGHDVVWFHNLDQVTAERDPRTAAPTFVAGMIKDNPATTFDLQSGPSFTTGNLIVDRPYAKEWQIFNTTGKRRIVKIREKNNALLSTEQKDQRMAWFIRREQQVGTTVNIKDIGIAGKLSENLRN
ncbi:MAG: hypothetical protein EX271_06800 [Acidimicrobiales bacterium]|nr:hypothetical protein [Hyphomonadaceae bacterium]RZV42028.1 MAG: hypothetical protein EX271_06800 [Acidimicrobiales bacterium]